MNMGKALKAAGVNERNVENMAEDLESRSGDALQPSDDIDGEPEKAVFRPEEHNQLPMDTFTFLILNNVPFAEASVLKYVMRWREQGGVEELRKARRLIEMMIEMELNRSMYTPEKGWL